MPKSYLRFALSWLAGFALLVPSVSNACLTDFEGQTQGMPIGSFYASGGLTFDNGEWSGVFSNPPPYTGFNGFASISAGVDMDQANAIVVTFAEAILGASVLALDVGSDGARIDAYDALVGGTLVDFDEAFGTGLGIGNNPTLSVSGMGIRRLEFYQPNEVSDDGISFDILTMRPSAEPSARWVLYDRASESVEGFASLADLVAGTVNIGPDPIVPTGAHDLASDGSIWALYDSTAGTVRRFGCLDDLITGTDVAGAESITPVSFDGIAADANTWVLYDSTTEEVARYETIIDLISGNSIGGREAIVPTGFENVASDGDTWVLYDFDAEEIVRYASLGDLIAGIPAGGVEAIAPAGYEGIGATTVPVPEPSGPAMLFAGLAAIGAIGRKRARP